MRSITKIAVVGATGRLGAPVAAEIAKTFQVRAIVRSPDKARTMLPAGFEIVEADLRDVDSLRAALQGVDAIYLNLSTETADPNLSFYEEREGVANLLAALRGLDIRYIAKIGALGAYPPAAARIKHNVVPNLIRMQGHAMIAASGIPHSFFAPTHFMELLPMMIDKRALRWVGNTGVKIYWISVTDYARQVAKAFQHPEAMPQDVPVQGPEAITVERAMKLFVANHDPTLKIRVAPVWVMRIIGLFNPKMRFVAQMFSYFGDHEDPFYAERTWRELGKPTMTLVEFAKGLRRRAGSAA